MDKPVDALFSFSSISLTLGATTSCAKRCTRSRSMFSSSVKLFNEAGRIASASSAYFVAADEEKPATGAADGRAREGPARAGEAAIARRERRERCREADREAWRAASIVRAFCAKSEMVRVCLVVPQAARSH